MNPLRGAWWSLALTVGCSASHGGPPASAATDPSGRAAAVPVSITVASPLLDRVGDIARQVASHGVTLRGTPRSGFITHGTAVTTPLEIAANRCMAIVTLGSAGIRDLDAHVYDPDGTLVVEDVETDAHPTVLLCATVPRRVYHVIEAFEGQGAYALATFDADRAGLDEVVRVVGGHPGTAVGSGGDRSGAERRLTEFRDGVLRRGFTVSGDPARAAFTGAGAQRLPLVVTPDHCYTVAALPDGDITDADVSVYDSTGEEIARDVRPDRDAFVQFCPPAAATVAIEVRARPGVGTVVVQSFAADAASVGGANTLWLGERTAWGASARPLAETEASVVHGLAAEGYTEAAPRQGMHLAPGEVWEGDVTLTAGRCTALAAVGGRGLGRLDLQVWDPAGDLVARGTFQDGAAVGVPCPAVRETLRVRVTADVGAGEASLLRVQGGAAPPWSIGVDRVAVSESMASHWTTREPWGVTGVPERVHLGARAMRTRELDRGAGRCVRLGVSAGHGLPWVSVVLRGADGRQLAATTGEGSALVTRCGASAEHLRAELATEPAGVPETDGVVTVWERAAP